MIPHGERRAHLLAAAAECGCIVGPEGRAATGAPAETVWCTDGWGAARLLAALTRRLWRPELTHDVDVQRVAAWVSDAATPRERVRRIMSWMQEHVAFEAEQGEQFQAAGELIRSGVGDCDCHARLVATLAHAAGLPVQFVFLSSKGGPPRHVVCRVHDGSRWQWLETTVQGARIGEEPTAAAMRAGVARPDIVASGAFAERTIMGTTGIRGGQTYDLQIAIEDGEYSASDLAANYLTRDGWSVEHVETIGGIVHARATYQRPESREWGTEHETDGHAWRIEGLTPVVPEVFGDPPRQTSDDTTATTEEAANVDGRYYPRAKTPVSKDAFGRALAHAWPGVTRAATAILWAQYAIETGRGSACWNWNLGNVKKVRGDGRDYTMLQNVVEYIDGKRVIFQPPNPQTWFRAYTSLDAAMVDWLALVRKRYASAWHVLEGAQDVSASAAAYAAALKRGGYYTAPLESYRDALVSLAQEWMRDPTTKLSVLGGGVVILALAAGLTALVKG